MDQDDKEINMENKQKEILKNEIEQKTKFLINLGLDKRKIRIILEENEEFLQTNLKNIAKNIDILKTMTNDLKIGIILEETPQILTLENEDLLRKKELFEKLLSKKELEELVNYQSYIFEYKYEYLKDVMKLLYKNNLKDRILDIIVFHSEIFDLPLNEIKIEEYK